MNFPLPTFIKNILQNETSLPTFTTKPAEHSSQITAINAIALTTLVCSIWQLVQGHPWSAAKVGISGICLKFALDTIWPNKKECISMPFIEEEKTAASLKKLTILETLLADIEKCHPVPAVEPRVIKNHQIGGMMGQALGDAIGLFTEFTSKTEATELINGKPIELNPYEAPKRFLYNPYNWGHVERFVTNGWTDDTDQALSLLRALFKQLDMPKDEDALAFSSLFAKELLNWAHYGLKEEEPFQGRSNPYCMGMGALVGAVLSRPTFLKNPIQTSKRIWSHHSETPLSMRPAANGALMRTSPVGMIFYRSLNDVVKYSTEACKVTHYDPRCVASCVAFNIAIALAIRGCSCEEIFKAAEDTGLAVLRQELENAAEENLLSAEETANLEIVFENVKTEFLNHLHGDWERLDLDEGWNDSEKQNKIGYTFKCMGSAFYCLRLADQYQKDNQAAIFRTLIERLAEEGGDADTNGAAAGALIGVFLGFQDQFPENWKKHLADKKVLIQAIKHVYQLSAKHQEMLEIKK